MYRVAVWTVIVLCLVQVCEAQQDLTRRFEPDAATFALYHLDEAASGHVTDAAGGMSGAMRDAVATLGRFDGGVSCDGMRGWVDIPQPSRAITGSGLTVECWVQLRRSAHGDIICRNQSYMMRLDGGLQAYLYLDGAWRKVVGRRAVPTKRWTHLALTYDRGTRQVRTYIDGRVDVAEVPDGVTAGILRDGDRTLRLGSNTWSPESAVLDGKLDEVRISSVARQYVSLSEQGSAPVPTETNLLANPSFEAGLDGWRAQGEANTSLQWRVVTDGAPHGQSYLRSTEVSSYALISHPLAVVPGKVHTLSATMRADAAIRVPLTLSATGVPREAQRPSKSQSVNVTNQWQRFVAQFEIREDWPSERAYISFGKPAGTTLELDAVSLLVGERGEFSQTDAQSLSVQMDMPAGNLLVRGEQVNLPARAVNSGPADREVQIDYRIDDWLGREVAAGRLFAGTISTGQAAQFSVPVPTQSVGWLSLWLQRREQGELLSETKKVVNVIAPLKRPGEVFTSPLGMNTHMERESNEHLECNLAALSRCGVTWIRAWWGWGMAEKEPGHFNWSEYDRQLEAVHRAGLEIMPILLRYYPQYEQSWAGKTDRIQQPPSDLQQWGNFVEATVRRYRGRVKAWEVWNEPIYTMSAQVYAPLLAITHERIKKADPDALVVGFAGVDLDYIREVLTGGGAKTMDVLSHHSYRQLGHPWEQMAQLAADTDALVKQHAPAWRPRIWHSEQGSGADGVGYLYLADSEQQCAVNLVQAYLSALSTGVEKFFWFSAQTSPTYGWGVFYEDYVPRPRLIALHGLARLLEGRHVIGRSDLGERQVACVLLDGEAGPAAAVWNLGRGVSLELPAEGDFRLHDMLGNRLGGDDASLSSDSPRKVMPRSVTLEQGRPVYVTSQKLAAQGLAAVLRQAETTPLGDLFPIRASADRTAGGHLEIRLDNTTDEHLDVRVRVSCPDLFAVDPPPWQATDLKPHEARSTVLLPDQTVASGTGVRVVAELAVGGHGIQEHRVVWTVSF